MCIVKGEEANIKICLEWEKMVYYITSLEKNMDGPKSHLLRERFLL